MLGLIVRVPMWGFVSVISIDLDRQIATVKTNSGRILQVNTAELCSAYFHETQFNTQENSRA